MKELQQLATHCLADYKFYGTGSENKIEVFNSYFESMTDIEIHLDDKTVSPKAESDMWFWRIKNNFIKKNFPGIKDILPKDKGQLKISFENEPAIYLQFDRFYVDSRKVKCDYHPETEKIFWWFNRTINYSFEYSIYTYKVGYYLQCGSIKEMITEEEYKNMIKTFRTNRNNFKTEADAKIIKERLNHYTHE